MVGARGESRGIDFHPFAGGKLSAQRAFLRLDPAHESRRVLHLHIGPVPADARRPASVLRAVQTGVEHRQRTRVLDGSALVEERPSRSSLSPLDSRSRRRSSWSTVAFYAFAL